jgi:hypothetical protein
VWKIGTILTLIVLTLCYGYSFINTPTTRVADQTISSISIECQLLDALVRIIASNSSPISR